MRYADDWCLVISGTKADAETLREEIAGVLSTIGLRLSQEKTLITHIDEGLMFLGWRIQRHRKRGTNRYYVYTYPPQSRQAVMGKVKTSCRRMDTNQPLDVLLLSSTRCCGAGAPTSGPACPARPSPTSATTRGLGSADGCAANTAGAPGRNSVAATAEADGGRARGKGQLFNPAKVRTTRYRYRATAAAASTRPAACHPWPG